MSSINLDTLLESISPKAGNPDQISGKKLLLKRSDVEVFLGLDGRSKIHVLIGPTNASVTDKIREISLKNLDCGILQWSVDKNPVRTFIDVSVQLDRQSLIRKPFLSFAEDLVAHIDKETGSPDQILAKVFRKWRKFWTGGPSRLPTEEWIKGIFGELTFLIRTIESSSSRAVFSWEGPTDGLHDFRHEAVAFEVKSSISNPVIVKIHGLSQLDPKTMESLYLVVFRLQENASGKSICTLVKQIEDLLSDDNTALEEFWDRLARAGYRRDLEYHFEKYCYLSNEPEFYPVDEEFPKLTKDSLTQPIDTRIFEIKYSLQLSGLSPVDLGDSQLKSDLARLGQSSPPSV